MQPLCQISKKFTEKETHAIIWDGAQNSSQISLHVGVNRNQKIHDKCFLTFDELRQNAVLEIPGPQ